MRTGHYQNQLQDTLKYKAFVPNHLPFKINLNDKLQSLLSRADLALGRLDGMADTLPDLDFFILMYVRKEATISSQIEGTQATFFDLISIMPKEKKNSFFFLLNGSSCITRSSANCFFKST